MTGAIDFLRKAKAICENMDACIRCPLAEMCLVEMNRVDDEADLVRKVMDYRLEATNEATKAQSRRSQ